MTSRYTVGSVVGADDLDALPNGTKLEFTAGGLRISEVPPQDERDRLACELWTAVRPSLLKRDISDFASSESASVWKGAADFVLSNFTRNGAQSPGDPDTVLDDSGDRWYRMDNGNYTMSVGREHDAGGTPLADIAETWGPLSHETYASTSGDLIDRDGDRWEKQPDGKYRMRDTFGDLCEDSQTYDYLDRTYFPLRAAA